MFLAIINGPNLNLLGKREPQIYGSETFEATLDSIRQAFPGQTIEYFQSNCEGELIDRIQQTGFDKECIGIVINPGAYAHYSIAIADAIAAIPVPTVEVHISNIHAREEFRKETVTGRACKAVIAGCGRKGYSYALSFLLDSHR